MGQVLELCRVDIYAFGLCVLELVTLRSLQPGADHPDGGWESFIDNMQASGRSCFRCGGLGAPVADTLTSRNTTRPLADILPDL